jgi:small subunit ribosomal protein S6
LQRSALGRQNMTLPAPTYDLVVLLDPQADDATREKLVADTRASIEAQGELLRHDDWGERTLTYPIDRKTSAQYHLLQFHATDVELLSGLDRTLRLADEVLRFRIIKLAPGVPAAPEMSSGAAAARPPDGAAEPAADAAPAPAESPSPPSPGDETEAVPAQSEPEPVEADAGLAVGEPS